MPRGRKKKEPTSPAPVVETKKPRKPYPSQEERIALADEQISHWERLNTERRELIAATEKKLSERKELLAKGEVELERILARKQHLIQLRDGIDPRSEKKKQYTELLAALKASGKTMDDVLANLKN